MKVHGNAICLALHLLLQNTDPRGCVFLSFPVSTIKILYKLQQNCHSLLILFCYFYCCYLASNNYFPVPRESSLISPASPIWPTVYVNVPSGLSGPFILCLCIDANETSGYGNAVFLKSQQLFGVGDVMNLSFINKQKLMCSWPEKLQVIRPSLEVRAGVWESQPQLVSLAMEQWIPNQPEAAHQYLSKRRLH